jgi:hypothetical protein
MTRYAAALDDLDAIWRVPLGAALVDAVLARPASEEPKLVTADDADAVVLTGRTARVEALVAGLVGLPIPDAPGRTVRVFAHGASGWRRVEASPSREAAPERATARRGGGIGLRRPSRPGPERASHAHASRFHTSGIGA